MVNKPEQNPPDPSANRDDEAVWLDLVARLEETSSDYPDAPVANSFRDFDPLGIAAPPQRPTAPATPEETGSGHSDAWSGETPAEDGGTFWDHRGHSADYDDDGFVPQEPESLSNIEPALILAWIGAVGGPIGLLMAAILWRNAPLTAIIGIIAVFVISAGYLMFRLPAEREDNGDDGAVL
ncbi:hypothetical protein [Paenarthrobacter sp. Z7-10]|uniref:hypothetical protein n=1 Tax=Paenarthrobacter sp. Z7-10 TaxID=2787635 RepID=UPI0022A9E937|nr:hypothetical protein [Paenarthrobacter sp. Z7-10]